MQEILNALSNPGAMSSSQWLVLAIGAFIVLGSIYFIIKLFKLLKGIGKTTYTPNIGLSRHPYQGESVSKGPDHDSGEKQSGEVAASSDNIDKSDTKAE